MHRVKSAVQHLHTHAHACMPCLLCCLSAYFLPCCCLLAQACDAFFVARARLPACSMLSSCTCLHACVCRKLACMHGSASLQDLVIVSACARRLGSRAGSEHAVCAQKERGLRTGSRSACSRRFSAGSRGELIMHVQRHVRTHKPTLPCKPSCEQVVCTRTRRSCAAPTGIRNRGSQKFLVTHHQAESVYVRAQVPWLLLEVGSYLLVLSDGDLTLVRMCPWQRFLRSRGSRSKSVFRTWLALVERMRHTVLC